MASHASRRSERQTFKRFEWADPGALLHMDVKRLARFDVPGHWAMGRSEQHKTRRAGWVYLHVVIDDHSRYLYVEQHDREDADTNADTLQRAIAHLSELGLSAPQAVMNRQRAGLHQLTTLPPAPRRDRRQTHHHPALHAPLERQSRASHPHLPRRMGLRARLGQLPTTHQGPAIIRALLQPQATTQQPRRPATHQPRSQRPWSGHLDRAQEPSGT